MFTSTTTAITVTRSLRLGLAAAAMAALTGLAGCANNDPSSMPGMDTGSSASAAPSIPAAPSASAGSATPASGPHNDADVTFAQMMIQHHQQAVDMSDMLLAKDGVNPEIAALARQIKTAQAPEITTMTGWLEGWGEPVTAAEDGMGGMGGMDHGGGDDGMMAPDEMEDLDTADGATGQKLYLEGMIKHHQGAVAMAEDEVANGENPQAKQLAQDIITSQQAEIETMSALLDAL